MAIVEPGKQFAKDSIRLLKRCTKPDRKGEFNLMPKMSPHGRPDHSLQQNSKRSPWQLPSALASWASLDFSLS